MESLTEKDLISWPVFECSRKKSPSSLPKATPSGISVGADTIG